jgi:hypothetical protein
VATPLANAVSIFALEVPLGAARLTIYPTTKNLQSNPHKKPPIFLSMEGL